MSNLDFFPKIERAAGAPANSKASGAAKNQGAKKGGDARLPSFADVVGEGQGSVQNPASSEKTGSRPRLDESGAIASEPIVPAQSLETAMPKAGVDAIPEVTPVNISGLEVVDATHEQKAVLKQQAVLEFMDQMQTKFGVTPEKIMGAFAQLDEKALNGRPEDAMAQFLAQLQIPAGQIKDAEKLYQKMVQSTGEAALNEKLGVGKKIVNLQVLSPKEQRTNELRGRLDAMSDKFFRRGELTDGGPKDPFAMMGFAGPEAGPPEGSIDPNAEPQPMRSPEDGGKEVNEQKSDQGSGFGVGLGALTGAGLAVAGTTAQSMSAAGTPVAGHPSARSAMSSLTEDAAEFGEASDEAMEEFLAGSGTGADAGAGLGQSPGQTAAAGFGASLAGAAAAATAASKAVSGYAAGGGESKSEKAEVTIDGSAGAVAPGVGQAPGTDVKGATLAPAAMLLEQPQTTPEQKQENINEIIRQAQVIMKRGGGEMKLQLQPEGLGQVNLKVLVQDGQVNVQMMAENDAAKKILENGLSDLKAQLAAHKLHVETLKVDMQADAGMKKFEQGFGDAQREQARQFASDFMGQFRDERQGFFSSYMDRPNMKGYARAQKRAPIEPTPADGVQAASSRGKNGENSRRLDLVA